LLNLSTVPRRHPARIVSFLLVIPLLAVVLCPAVRGQGKDKDKDKPKKEDKKEKVEPWVEIRTANFVVASDGGEKTARHVADQFEMVRRVFQATMPNARFNTGIPIQILAARDGQSFARLFPEFPFDKKRPQPNGLFVAGQEKVYIGIRTNVSGPVPYDDIYRDYSRLVLKLSYRSLPPWLEEGYSNVYGSMTFTDKGARLGRPDPDDMSTLYESPLLPLDLVLHADRNSPYYSAGEKTTVYSAESRALVHFLLTDPQISASKALDQYIAKVEGGADALESAKQVFGDINQLQSRLEAYIKQTNAQPSEIAAAGGSDSGGSAKTLSAAEAEARMGNFSAARGRLDDAQDKLEDALNLDASVADAEQGMGFLALQRNELEDAEKHFTRATELDANDALSYYGEGLVAMSRGGFVGVPVGAVVAFEKTVALIPDFAPAWYNLASIYALRPETMQKALTDARRAASLAPGESGYQLQVANILDRSGRMEDSRKTASAVQPSSSDPKGAAKPGDIPAQIPQQQKPAPSATASSAPANSSSAGTLRIERKTEPDEPKSTASTSASRTEPAPAPPPVIASEPHAYSMIGTITDVVCTNAPQIQITVKAQTIVMHLHADDLGHVTIKAAGSNDAIKNAACASLRGRTARVSYMLVSDKAWDGEMQTVEFR
jgi:tetratricopeptide (TPR) repeat protein